MVIQPRTTKPGVARTQKPVAEFKVASDLDYTMDKGMRGGALVASFPVVMSDQIMLATSTGQSIRVPVDQISFRSRAAGGVKVFNVGAGEEVVSVARVAEQEEE